MNWHDTEIIARYAETDKMGIIHHSVYPIWFEAGRTEYIRHLGLSYSEVEKEGLMLPLRSYRCEFLIPARYEDRIIIKTRIKDFNGVRLNFIYEVINKETNEVLTKGESEHVWADSNLKPINLKKKSQRVYNIIDKAMYTEE